MIVIFVGRIEAIRNRLMKVFSCEFTVQSCSVLNCYIRVKLFSSFRIWGSLYNGFQLEQSPLLQIDCSGGSPFPKLFLKFSNMHIVTSSKLSAVVIYLLKQWHPTTISFVVINNNVLCKYIVGYI